MYKFLYISLLINLISCNSTDTPKPKGALRLDYKTPSYRIYRSPNHPYSFEMNTEARAVPSADGNLNIEYPKMKATLYLSYKPIEKNLENLLKDAQKLTYEHTLKADNIIAQDFINDTLKVYGTFYEVEGNAASQAQFYATDSLHYFLAGSVYFRVKPNYDSILPAANYLKNDLRKLLESLRWENSSR